MENFSLSQASNLTFMFLETTEEPLMKQFQVTTFVTSALIVLCFGLIINGRILRILSSRNNGAAIDKLFFSSTVFSIVCHPIIIIYYILKELVYPMKDMIGLFGCLFTIHFLDVFVRFYNFCFPASIAIIRYLFVVESLWVKSKGMKKITNWIIAASFIVPFFMTVSVQFPIGTFVHGPFHFCMGRFETLFNPMHEDAITPGRREGERHCIETERWAFQPDAINVVSAFRIFVLANCKLTRFAYYIFMMSLPEIVLYSATFTYIRRHIKTIALSGILNPEVIKRRKQQNTVNIKMTCCTWLAQFITNIIYIIVLKLFFGKIRFYQAIFAVITISLNFNILPLFYIVLADNDFKSAVLRREYFNAFKIFFVSQI